MANINIIRPTVVVFSKVAGLVSKINAAKPTFDIVEIPVPDGDQDLFGDVQVQSLPAVSQKMLRDAEVLLGDPGLLQRYGLIQNLPSLKWMQSTWAGVDTVMAAIDRNKPMPSYKLTRLGGWYNIHIAQFIIGYIIAHERNFQLMRELQNQQTSYKALVEEYRLLSHSTMGIVGLGDVGNEVARAAKCFRMGVVGLVNRDLPKTKRSPHVDEYFRTLSQLPTLLERSDYVINILPSTALTKGALSGDILRHCNEKKSVLINVGRGDVIDEWSLINALERGWISHAILDVFSPEPLPSTSALWKHPGITITPHVAAVGVASEVCESFMSNYEKYVAGKALDYEVSWDAEY